MITIKNIILRSLLSSRFGITTLSKASTTFSCLKDVYTSSLNPSLSPRVLKEGKLMKLKTANKGDMDSM